MAILATLLLATAMDMVLAMTVMGMESVMLSQRLMPMLSMDHMESTVLDTALILWDMVMAILATVMDMDIMVDQSETTNQERHYNDLVPPPRILVQIYFLVCFIYRLSFHSDHLLCIAKITLVNRP